METKPKALVLLSGGLDSMLAAELLRRCGVEVKGVAFTSPFFGSRAAEKAAERLGIELRVEDITEDHLEVVRNPRFGYGKNLNPCIDCHILMVKRALEIMEEEGALFIATGEVLGERPKSQNLRALRLVAEHSGAGELLLRPLSAGLLPPTRPEKEGWVPREKLLDIRGRSRRRQMDLAAEWGIEEYQSPAGGCLLTDPGFSRRLGELMKRVPAFDREDAVLMRLGRHFWLDRVLIVIGRRHEENEALLSLSLPTDLLLRERERPGPLGLIRAYPRGARPDRRAVEEAARLLGRYGKGKEPLAPEDLKTVEPPSAT